ncbi:MAG: fibronectin type III domain-containing protein [Streptosporangiaceae bacterium]
MAALLGFSGHGLPALGTQLLTGQAWLVNTANRSVSLIDGYSGKVSSQVGIPGGSLQLANTPGGAAVVGPGGHLVAVSDDNFTTSGQVANPVSGAIELVGGGASSSAAAQNALYAIDEAAGKIQQLDPSSTKLAAIGSPVSIGKPVTAPVVAPDGSLYVAISDSGDVGHVTAGNLVLIKGVSRPGDRLAVVLAGAQVVAADLTSGTVMPLGPSGVSGPRVRLPRTLRAFQMTGSDINNGLIGLVSAHAVTSASATSGTVSASTPLPAGFRASDSAMQGSDVVLIDSAQRKVVVVDTATRQIVRQVSMAQEPNQITVRDRLVFVNASDGASALVINGAGVKQVTKYTGPPPAQHKTVKLPTPVKSKTPVVSQVTPRQGQRQSQTPHRPGAPAHPAATPGNAQATVSWGAAAANGSAIKNYVITWSGGQKTVSGGTMGTTITGLSNGTSYVFTIAAVNGLGQGPDASTPAVTPSSNVPNAPGNVQATASEPDGSVSLTWSAPSSGAAAATYTVTEVGPGTQLLTGVTGTSATIGPSQGLEVGSPVQFQVTAVTASELSSTPSAPSAAVTPYQDPSAPAVQVASIAQTGTSATLSVSCDTTCQGGLPAQTYQVTLSPAGPSVSPVTAAAGGAATTVTLTGLTPNTSYTAAVTVTDTAGATGPANTVPIPTPGPPSVSNVAVSAGSGLALNVTATVNTGGETTNCSISVSGGGSASGSCSGTISVNVSTYNTSYTVTFTATNAAGSNQGTGSGKSGLKALTANATDAFGTCPGISKYCGGDSNMEPTPNFVANNGAPGVPEGTTEMADCWTTGGVDHGTVAYTSGSTQWVHIPSANGYMSILWFPDPPSVISGLPQC